ncbi:MAG: pyk, Pyruvate kinase [Candidatus Saccharibacteria bacterium]|nr:pyk, Pyruvate kinase [Candidatus Saccharibacteria bacterium]
MTDLTAPNVPIAEFKRTKIIATVGPSTDSFDHVLQLIKYGANGLRLNFSHGTHEEHGQRIKWIRKAAKAAGKPVAIIQDLQGPKVRLGDFDGVINVRRGQALRFEYISKRFDEGIIPTQYDLSKKVKRGERIYLYDGKVRTTVSSVKDGIVHVKAENDGILIKRKGMNLPDTDFGGDIFTKKDREDLAYGSTQDIDYVALSFVQTADDIDNLRKRLKNLNSPARIIAKIETKAAVDNLEDIIKASDAVMIARGDLAVETPAESVPIVQRQIIGLGIRYAKPTIVATQMLASMTEAPEPTRAEVSDIATAVLVGADCVMLSDETASGRYPIEAVQVMKRVIRYTESNAPVKPVFPIYEDSSKAAAISDAVINLATSVKATAIVAETQSGATALALAAKRSDVPLIAVTDSIRTAQQLAIVYDVKSYVQPVSAQAAQKLTDWLQRQKVLVPGNMIVTATGKYPGVVGTTDTIKVRVIE